MSHIDKNNMLNISLNKEIITLKEGEEYFIIDSLYLNIVKAKIELVNPDTIETDIRHKIFKFPYTQSPFVIYKAEKSTFNIIKIIKANINDPVENYFSTDTGMILFIRKNIFLNVLNKFDYNKLLNYNSNTNIIDVEYWGNMLEDLNFYDVGLVLSPGINNGVEFDGSGDYKITA